MSEITKEDEVGVLELGMSEPGELTVIARIAKPDVAVITNIGITHIEQLGWKRTGRGSISYLSSGRSKGMTIYPGVRRLQSMNIFCRSLPQLKTVKILMGY